MTTPLTLMEECRGTGRIEAGETSFAGVEYEISRYQGLAASGLPIPGLHRIEGRVSLERVEDGALAVGDKLVLRLDDGRALRITLADATGRVLAEGHGPSQCRCC